VKDDIILTNGEFIIDHEAKVWLDQVCGTIKDAVGDHPKMRMYPYRKDGCDYLAMDFDESVGNVTGRKPNGFSLTIAIAPYGKCELEIPKVGCQELVPTIRDSLDAITIAGILATRLNATVFFNLWAVES
jgi:hypothetical protein